MGFNKEQAQTYLVLTLITISGSSISFFLSLFIVLFFEWEEGWQFVLICIVFTSLIVSIMRRVYINKCRVEEYEWNGYYEEEP